jgi:hypothetical protein
MKSASVSKQASDDKQTKKVERSFIKKYIYRAGSSWYPIGVIVRILWTVVYPQQGYIHPVRQE